VLRELFDGLGECGQPGGFKVVWRSARDSKLNELLSSCIASLSASALAAQKLYQTSPAPLYPTASSIFTLALDLGAPGAVASAMAQPNAEPEEDYEYVAI
jgi:hypothetical protein